MTAIERIRKAAEDRYNKQAQEIAEAAGKTIAQAKVLMEIENEIQAEHERLTGTQAPYIL